MKRIFPALLAVVCPLVADSLSGTVTDPSGAAIAGARIRLYTTGATPTRQAATDAAGGYRFEGLAAGGYLVEVEAGDFRPAVRRLTLTGAGQENFRLEVGGVRNTVQVTAEGAALAIDETAKAVTVIDGAEIRARNEVALAEVLRTAPGVQIRNQGGPGQFTQIRIRGLRPDAAQVLVDGFRFRDASTLQGDVTPFAASLNVVSLERVEVMRGSGGSLFGTQSVGGSINLVTAAGGSPARGTLLAEGGGLGFLRGHAGLAGGALNDRLGFAGGLTHVNVVSGVDGNDRHRSTGGQAFARFDLTPHLHVSDRLFASGDFAQNNTSAATTGIPAGNFPSGAIVPARMLPPDQVRVLNQGGAPVYGAATLVPTRDDPDNHRAGQFTSNLLLVRGEWSRWASWQAGWQRLRTDRRFTNGPGGFGFQPVGFATVTAPEGAIDTVDARWHAGFERWRTTVGFEFEREAFHDRQDNQQPGNARLVVDSRLAQHSRAVYAQQQFALFARRLQISLSGRRQGFQLRTPRFDMRGIRNPYAAAGTVAPPVAWTGDAAVAWFAARTGTKLRGHAGNSYRAPSLYERYGGGFFANPATGDVSFTPYGDPRLGPDRYVSFDAGVDQYLFRERLRLSATGFYVRTQQVILFDFSGAIRPATDPYGRTSGYTMGPGAINRGLELALEARPGRSTVITGSYTFVNANTDRDAVVPGFFRALNVPRHVASVVATRSFGARLDVTVEVFRSAAHFINYFAAGRTRAFAFAGFTKADLSASYRVWSGDQRALRLTLKADNILNRTYYENGTLNPRGWVIGGLSYSF